MTIERRQYEGDYFPCSKCGATQPRKKLTLPADGCALACIDGEFCARAKEHREEELRKWERRGMH